ncbi:MAG: STAS-like domain-containing protein [Desulfovibrio sp.]|nr:STAS-like domain-containing protein [Desulfovibrio sp.]
MSRLISIAQDFSVYPGGRIPADGPFSGEEFRNDYLLPIFNSNEHVTIDFDNVRGYGSSFLEEAFGGLVRSGISPARIREQIIFKSSKDSIVSEIWRYINNADTDRSKCLN